jgi:predicted Ser/Thr protein kinase
MPLQDCDILLGKLAIGRQYVSRQDAVRIAEEVSASVAQGRSESFPAAAMRLGYLKSPRVDELLAVIKHGALVCRGTCGETYRLSDMRSEETAACRHCGGPLFVQRQEDAQAVPAAPATPLASVDAVGDSVEEEGSMTFLELDAPEMPPPELDAPAPPPAPIPPAPVPPAPVPPAPVPPAPVPPAPEPPGPVPDAGMWEGDAASTFLDLDDDFDEEGPDDPEASPPSPGDEAGEKTLEIDQETFPSIGGPAFEPFEVGPLRIHAPIGKGGMGTVYRAQDEQSGQVRAVKILSGRAQLNDEALSRFKREVLLSARLNHPNIVQVYEAGRVPSGANEGRPFYVMDYVRGRDLIRWREESGRSIEECVAVVETICDGMNHAHSHGVVHRDIKPANVLMHTDGHPVICDFGLAKCKVDLQNLTQTGEILGTPSYMPPEQALGKHMKIGPPTDVYAIGAVLFFLLTGKPPFLAPTAFATIHKVVHDAPTAPSSLNPQVTPALDAVVLKALAKEPVDRYHTCRELRDALVSL